LIKLLIAQFAGLAFDDCCPKHTPVIGGWDPNPKNRYETVLWACPDDVLVLGTGQSAEEIQAGLSCDTIRFASKNFH